MLECVGTEEARAQAVAYARPGGMIGLVGVPHGDLPTDELFWANKGVRGGPAPVRAYLPHLLDLVWQPADRPGQGLRPHPPLSEVAEAYRAMDERRAIKVLLAALSSANCDTRPNKPVDSGSTRAADRASHLRCRSPAAAGGRGSGRSGRGPAGGPAPAAR